MLIAARNGFLAKTTGHLKWVDRVVFDASDYVAGTSNWYDTKREIYFGYMTRSGVVSKDQNGIHFSGDCNGFSPYVITTSAFTPILNIAFRVLVDATLDFSSSHDNIIIDSAIRGIGTGTRAFSLGYSGSGRAYANWKMNGNNSGKTFNPTERPVIFSPPCTINGVFECGCRPSGDGYVCYSALNGVDTSVGPVRQSSEFALADIVNGQHLGASTFAGYGYVTGYFRTIRFQVLDQ